MRSPAAWIIVLGAELFATSAPNAAADVTVKGEVVEIICSVTKAAGRGDAHAACALDCAKRGEPLAVLADDGAFEITGDFSANKNARLLDFVAKSVTVTGTLSEQDGKKRLNIKTIRVNEPVNSHEFSIDQAADPRGAGTNWDGARWRSRHQ